MIRMTVDLINELIDRNQHLRLDLIEILGYIESRDMRLKVCLHKNESYFELL